MFRDGWTQDQYPFPHYQIVEMNSEPVREANNNQGNCGAELSIWEWLLFLYENNDKINPKRNGLRTMDVMPYLKI